MKPCMCRSLITSTTQHRKILSYMEYSILINLKRKAAGLSEDIFECSLCNKEYRLPAPYKKLKEEIKL